MLYISVERGDQRESHLIIINPKAAWRLHISRLVS